MTSLPESSATQYAAYTHAFAEIYDVVMRDVNYPGWAQHILNLCETYDLPHRNLLNMACGTGNLDALLAPHGIQITGIDASAPMLERARFKARLGGYDAEYTVGFMEEISLGRQFDLVLCLYDSLNYILDDVRVQAAFARAFEHTKPGGGYIFDITTPHNIIHNFANYTYAEDFGDYAYIWLNDYDMRARVCKSDLTIFLKDEATDLFRRYKEMHVQRMYEVPTLSRWVKQAGFRLRGTHDGLTLDPPSGRSERIHFVCQRPE